MFPDWLQPFLLWQPFRGVADVPFRIYAGHIPVDAAWSEIAMQWTWTALIVALGMWMLAIARKRLVVYGG